jgi:hypothetical protein
VDLSYSQIKRLADDGYGVYPFIYPYYDSYEGGELSFYSLKIGFALGTLSPTQPLFAYGHFSGGIHLSHTAEMKHTYYGYYDSSYHTSVTPAQTYTYLVLGIGGVFGYRFLRNFGVHAEIEYNMITSEGYFFFGRGYFPLRLGVSYFIR